MIEIFLNGVAPAFLVILVGTLVGPLVAAGLPMINRLTLYAAMPALVLVSLLDAELTPAGALTLVAGHGAYLAAMFVLASLLALRLAPAARRSLVATNLFVNAANLMLPVTLFTLGEEAFTRATILYVFVTILLYTLGPLVLAGREGFRQRSPLAVLRLPVIWAALLGLALNLVGVRLPIALGRGVSLLADAAIPLVLLVLGIQVYRSGWRWPNGVSLTATAVKLVVGPAVGFGVAWALGARDLDLAVLTLLAAMPPAVNNLILTLEFGGDAEQVTETIVLATVVSLVTITVVVRLVA